MHRRTVVVSLLAIALLAWFLRNANLSDVWAHVRTARVDFLLLSLLFVALTFWARAIRWQHLLAPVGRTRFRTAFRTTVIGFAALSVLPLRAGDVLRPYLLARREGLRATSVFATIVMERVLDLMAVLALLALYVWLAGTAVPDAWRPVIRGSAVTAAAAAVGLFVLTWVLAWRPERIGALVVAVTPMLPRRLGHRLGDAASTFSAGFAVAREPRALLLAAFWSLPVWLLVAAEVWAVSAAFDIDLPYVGAFLVQTLLVIGVAVPTPAGIGAYHEAYRIAVTEFFNTPNDRAVAAALVVHAIAFVPIVLAGAVFMAQDGLSFARIRELSEAKGAAPESDGLGREGAYTDEVSVLRSSRR